MIPKVRMWSNKINKYFDDSTPNGLYEAMSCLKQQVVCHWDHVADGMEFEQFTGLHDKNGKEIYEGDIIRYNSEHLGESIGLIEYLVWPYGSEFSKKWIKGGCGLRYNQYEIIGNIHEHPYLLQE